MSSYAYTHVEWEFSYACVCILSESGLDLVVVVVWTCEMHISTLYTTTLNKILLKITFFIAFSLQDPGAKEQQQVQQLDGVIWEDCGVKDHGIN